MSPSSGQSRKQQSKSTICACVRVCDIYLLQESELLGNVVSTVFILAEGEMLCVCDTAVCEGAEGGHRQRCSDGEGLLLGQGHRGLHHSGKSPLKMRQTQVIKENQCKSSP